MRVRNAATLLGFNACFCAALHPNTYNFSKYVMTSNSCVHDLKATMLFEYHRPPKAGRPPPIQPLDDLLLPSNHQHLWHPQPHNTSTDAANGSSSCTKHAAKDWVTTSTELYLDLDPAKGWVWAPSPGSFAPSRPEPQTQERTERLIELHLPCEEHAMTSQ